LLTLFVADIRAAEDLGEEPKKINLCNSGGRSVSVFGGDLDGDLGERVLGDLDGDLGERVLGDLDGDLGERVLGDLDGVLGVLGEVDFAGPRIVRLRKEYGVLGDLRETTGVLLFTAELFAIIRFPKGLLTLTYLPESGLYTLPSVDIYLQNESS